MTARGIRRLADWFDGTAKKHRGDDDLGLYALLIDISIGLHALARLVEREGIDL